VHNLIPILVLVATGTAAGAINAVAGSGSLLTFPTLLALGYSPLVANVSNTVGLTVGGMSSAVGYRRELSGQRTRLLHLGACSLVGGFCGAILLLILPASVFQKVVPALVLLAVGLLLIQPWLSRVLAARHPGLGGPVALRASILAAGVYGGYFGAALGVLFMAILGLLVDDSMQRLSGLKTVLATIANGIASIVFIFRAPVAWEVALLIAISSAIGGQLGAAYGRKLPAPVLRTVLVTAGIAVVLKLLL